ncbi:molybdenum cofactor biosynthesis protein MoaE [Kocuria tytonis]|uniref:Molybdenum cofactor biosynthesis protein MoaE n=1 Tax=Kocuria tytonis TaxID=2054280 RepID=A0A495AC62_9MICC|nr:molybdenum cofactor biosynthesis protein MoaE [Kocuria tytonis]
MGRRAEVVIVSSSAAEGTAEDRCGPLLRTWLERRGLRVGVHVVPDGPEVLALLRELTARSDSAAGPRFVITSGGTGLNSDDVTPEATARVVQRESPGIMHALWAKGLEKTTTAVMSRGVAGQLDRTFLVNLPGSRGGVKDGMAVLDPLLDHISAQLEDVHGHGEDRSVTRSQDEVVPVAAGSAPAAASSGTAAPVSPAVTAAADDAARTLAGNGDVHGSGRHDVARSPGRTPDGCPPGTDAAAARPGTAAPGADGTGTVLHAGIGTEPLDRELAHARVSHPGCGAVVGFSGVIRDHDGGREGVSGLEYTAHPSAGDVMTEVVRGIAREHPGIRVWAAHRIGALAVGESALEVAVAAAHRREAFEACGQLVDRIKERVPIWKRQDFRDGEHTWVGMDA